MSKTVITFSRQFGSGGSQVGQLVAARLGFKYADREILRRAAEAMGSDEARLARHEERVSPLWARILCMFSTVSADAVYVPPEPGTPPEEQVFTIENQIIRSIAQREDCVIVGRGAAQVLHDHPGVFRVFLYAPLEFRIRRVMVIYHAPNRERARAMIEQHDHERERFGKRMFGVDWLCATNYHLCVDTSSLPLPKIAELIVGFVEQIRQAATTESLKESCDDQL